MKQSCGGLVSIIFIFSDRRRVAKHVRIQMFDLFFDYERGKLGLFELMDLKEETTRILGRKADIMTRDSLHKVLRSRIEASALRVF
jgi:predicted nucleotidyltransferase